MLIIWQAQAMTREPATTGPRAGGRWQKRGCGGEEWEGGGRSCSFSRFHNTLILVSLFIVWSSWIVSNGYISNKGWISDYSCAEEFQLCFLFGFLLSLYLTKICLPSSAKIGQRHKVGKSWLKPTAHLLQGLASTSQGPQPLLWWYTIQLGNLTRRAPTPKSLSVGWIWSEAFFLRPTTSIKLGWVI